LKVAWDPLATSVSWMGTDVDTDMYEGALVYKFNQFCAHVCGVARAYIHTSAWVNLYSFHLWLHAEHSRNVTLTSPNSKPGDSR
jgi:hypothetical protein